LMRHLLCMAACRGWPEWQSTSKRKAFAFKG